MTKASDNPFPSLLFEEHVDPTAPAAGHQRLFIDTDHHLKSIDSSSTVTDWYTIATGNVATDTIWDAAGDLVVGSGSDAAGRLAIGAAGGALSVINSAVAWNSGTSFPGSKATGDRYWRTDLGLEFYWDGTRWVTTQEYSTSLSLTDALLPRTSSGNTVSGPTDYGSSGQWVTRLNCWTYVASTNDGSKYWTCQLQSRTAAGGTTSVGSSFSTSGDTADQLVKHTVTIGASVASTETNFVIYATKTSTPGGLIVQGDVFYRLIGT